MIRRVSITNMSEMKKCIDFVGSIYIYIYIYKEYYDELEIFNNPIFPRYKYF